MNYLTVPIDLSHSTFGYNYFSSAIKPSSSFNWYKLRSACQGAPKQSILKTKGRPFSGSVQNGQLLAKGEDFRHQFKAGEKKERAREKRRGKRAISEKQNREIQIQKWVSSIRGRSCKCKRLKVGLDFRYAQGQPPRISRMGGWNRKRFDWMTRGLKVKSDAEADGAVFEF